MSDTNIGEASIAKEYLRGLQDALGRLLIEQDSSIQLGATLIASTVASGGTIHAFGTGHSHMLAEELFYRAGGLVAVNPIIFDGLLMHHDPLLSTRLERLPGLAKALLDSHDLKGNDVAIIASNSGANAAVCEMAEAMQAAGVPVIAITSLDHATSKDARTSDRLRLHEIAQVVIDNGGVLGDASVHIKGFDKKVAPTSTVIGAAIINAMVAQSVANLVSEGFHPAVYTSSNTEGGDAQNAEYRHTNGQGVV
ncbi:sugar isomerase domain-containing protein [Candidatus Aquiluna sp. UB-MaderosW2red]|uniref:sugar isomerase domain-containing protein n=1 Tax=Candidatus Aquiluna sp. UB-MaderosW2red TaxID=1855377 RepID=UPI000875AF9A|nr:SIS domain-containing protein [Candidatus Aquiluna sp. UB-MaderosW2red]SCX03306.1 Uncharacterized protein, contains SIS (Sugar ISomerase) phosphosugar binding domain [Candidatus Aquiluna sp. UB-MaderosW2red]